MGLSIRAYARHRGVTDTAVHKAIRSGRINALSDGTIDPDQADAQWERNTSSPKTGTQRPAVKVKVPEVDGEGGGDRVGASAATNTGSGGGGAGGAGGTSLLQARTVNEVVKAQTNKVRLARLKGELIDRPQAIAHVFKLARSERDAWLNWPARVSAQMAAKLEIDAHTMHVALENAVREHLQELGNLQASVD
ncbi:MAG: elements of external origin [Gammaproteobacteria bacterium]|uniref:elements of external origin n=1 Tax=Rhodoferax sp. TaxID=50421 RepID=UPI00179FF79A|nr:elements of external origin [Rhodoferax sp.]MBU3899204.1 elements of external origin [Gammaproteobacteria bacterium]MBA3059128.1 elements of external origin [Rhodoferax sp.]MBU4082004.1 elements of external origin [Gammaproteobacteria bacterium]MBU4114001.1 elements of external origin [Gammaproteobacteria bacterium]MBU4172711.1 elements of external origin [Gammaproteobacteria bacterium]